MKNTRGENPLVVMTLAVTSIIASRFGEGFYTNSDVFMGLIAVSIMIAISVRFFTIRECIVYAFVWSLIAFHLAETYSLYGKKGLLAMELDQDALSSTGVTLSVCISIVVWFAAAGFSMGYRERRKK